MFVKTHAGAGGRGRPELADRRGRNATARLPLPQRTTGGNGFAAPFGPPRLDSSDAPRPPTAEENRWFSGEVHVHEPSLRVHLRTQFLLVPDIDDVVQESFLRLWRCAWGSPSAMRRRSCSRVRGTS